MSTNYGLGLDVCGPPSSPSALVSDMRALGATLVGLYVYNSSAPSCVRSAAYMQAVESEWGAPCVLPIITMASTDADWAAAWAAVREAFPTPRRVGHDLETYALPAQSVVRALWQAEITAGYSPGAYGFATTLASYPGFVWAWGVHSYTEGFGYLPPPYSMWQYTDQGKGPSGTTYDESTLAQGFSVSVIDPPTPPAPIPPLHSSGGAMIALLETPSGRADVFLVGSDGQVWWHTGQGAATAMAGPGAACGGSVRAISGSYWSDYSNIDLVAIDEDGSTRLGVAHCADQTFKWQAPTPGPALTPVGYVPPAELPGPLK